jgi:lipoate---protein ligase
MAWKLIETPAQSARENMELDARLLEELVGEEPILHLYDWKKPSLTFGHFAKPEELLNLEAAERLGFDWARRPTGGGVVFHAWDLAFSVLVPAGSAYFSQNTLDNYGFVHRVVHKVIEDFVGKSEIMELIREDGAMKNATQRFFCMARPTKYDLVAGGKKIAGAAQRKMKRGFLHQGTIALKYPDEGVLEKILPSKDVRDAMRDVTFPLLGEGDLKVGRTKLRELLKQHFIKL